MKKTKYIFFIFIILLSFVFFKQDNSELISTDTKTFAVPIDVWSAGRRINEGSIVDVDDYFQAYEIEEDDAVYRRIYGKSFPTNGAIKLNTLRYLKVIHYNFQHQIVVGEMIVHTNIAEDALEIFKELFEAEYEINSMYLVDNYWPTESVDNPGAQADTNSINANNSSGFNYRLKVSGSSLSKHAFGKAIDINPEQNPYVNSDGTSDYTDNADYINPENRNKANEASHIIKDNDTLVSIFKAHGFTWGGNWKSPIDYQHFEKEVSDNVSENSDNSSKTILLVAAHGSGRDCNHAATTINGKTYYENIESREMIQLIAEYFDDHDVKYEIANQIVGDAYWSDNTTDREASRSCTNPNVSNCCGFRTSTIGSYSGTLAAHVDSMGGNSYYSTVFELHFNGGGGDYSLVMGKEDPVIRSNGLEIAQTVVDTINNGSARFGTDTEYYGQLGTLNIYYRDRQIPTYYLETVFMDNSTQFQAYLDNKEQLAENLAKKLIEISPDTIGNGGNQYVNSGTIGGTIGGLTYDPFDDYYSKIDIGTTGETSCTNLFMEDGDNLNDLGQALHDLYFIIKSLAVGFAIVFSSIDIYKYLLDNTKKKIVQTVVKRLVVALIIFFLPDILDIIFHLYGLYDLSNCGIL